MKIGEETTRHYPIFISDKDRLRHIYIAGQTGTGKTNLLSNMISQDLINHNGVAFLDPHGDAVNEVLNRIPNDRIDDVIYFNPADLEKPVGFNPLANVEEDKKSLVVQGIISSFKSIWADTWGEGRMQYVFTMCLLAIMDWPGANLLWVNRFLTDKEFREEVLRFTRNPAVRHYWLDVFPKFKAHEQAMITSPIENKVGQLTTDPIVRNIFSQPSQFDIREVMDDGKIFLANLSQGLIGEANSNLLGALLVSQFQIAAMSRADTAHRKPFYLYLDEFQNFSTDSFKSILSEARKYGLSLTISHQYIDQIGDLQDAVFGNVGNMIILRVGHKDAEILSKQFGIPAQIFTDLSKFTARVRQLIDGEPSDIREIRLSKMEGVYFGRGPEIVHQARERYGTDRGKINQEIEEWYRESYVKKKC